MRVHDMRLDNHIVSECHFVRPIAIDPSSDVIGLKILVREARGYQSVYYYLDYLTYL